MTPRAFDRRLKIEQLRKVGYLGILGTLYLIARRSLQHHLHQRFRYNFRVTMHSRIYLDL